MEEERKSWQKVKIHDVLVREKGRKIFEHLWMKLRHTSLPEVIPCHPWPASAAGVELAPSPLHTPHSGRSCSAVPAWGSFRHTTALIGQQWDGQVPQSMQVVCLIKGLALGKRRRSQLTVRQVPNCAPMNEPMQIVKDTSSTLAAPSFFQKEDLFPNHPIQHKHAASFVNIL